MENREQANKRL